MKTQPAENECPACRQRGHKDHRSYDFICTNPACDVRSFRPRTKPLEQTIADVAARDLLLADLVSAAEKAAA